MMVRKYAKLSPPEKVRAIARNRLFAVLDQWRKLGPAIAVVGPPGSGKTTLISTWMKARSLRGVWYQVDPGDADPASLFHFLRQAMTPFSQRIVRKLPALTAEYLDDVPGFSRRFFRQLFEGLPEGALIVFDNYQEVPAGHLFHRLISDAIAETPPGLCVLVISRRDPPDCYARLVANEHVKFLDWDALRLTAEEARQLAAARGETDPDKAALMQERCAGWAAGFTLMLEQRATGRPLPAAVDTVDPGVFDYFASEIFDRMEPRTQQMLLMLSVVPHVKAAIAERITGMRGTVTVLDGLHQARMFTERRAGSSVIYQFHALFLEFLRVRAHESLSFDVIQALRCRTADALLETGDTELAIELYLQAGRFDQARDTLGDCAGDLIAQGRQALVLQWIERVPTTDSRAEFQLAYWRASALLALDPLRSLEQFEASHHHARVVGHLEYQLLAAAGAVQAIMLAYENFRPLERWIDAIQTGMSRGVPFETTDKELLVQSSLLVACSMVRPDEVTVDASAARVYELLTQAESPNLAVSAAAYLVTWGTTTGPIEVASRALAKLQVLLRANGVTAMTKAWALFLVSWYHCLMGDRARCLDVIAEIEALASREGLPRARRFSAIIGCWVEIHACNVGPASRWSKDMEALVDPRSTFDVASLEAGEAWLSVLRQEPLAALTRGRAAVAMFDASGSVMHRCNHRLSCIWGHILLGQHDQAREWIVQARALAERMRSNWQEIALRATEAWIALDTGDREVARERLSAAFTLSRKSGYDHALGQHMRPWMPRLCAAALEEGIESDYVRRLVRRFSWPPPPERPAFWAWHVRVLTLGRFQLIVAGEPLKFAHKAPRKPLTLLKAIVAMGRERVPQQRLIDALWPDEDGDLSAQSFAVAMKRLRGLLGSPDAVHLSEGLVSLNGDLVWTDVEATESRLTHARDKKVETILELYGGDFLPEEINAPWVVVPRERMRRQFIDGALVIGRQLEEARAWADCEKLYQRGLDADPLSESLYQGLMRSHLAQGRCAEGLSVFRRMRQILSVTLGIAPSQESARLAQQLANS